MSKQKTQRKGDKGRKRESSSRGRSAVSVRRKLPNWPMLIVALVGVALTGYITYGALSKVPLPYCGEGSDCDIVQGSRWGTFLGLPTAAWGLAGYLALTWVAWRMRDAVWHWRLSAFLAMIGLAVSVYLTTVSVVIIGVTCTYCLASLALWIIVTVTVIAQRPRDWPEFSWPSWAGQSAVLVVVIVAGLHLHYSGFLGATEGPEDPYIRSLATHLSDTGAIFYGAFW